MRVLITAAQFSSQLSGIQRHATMLTRALLEQAAVSAIDLVVSPWQVELFQHAAEDPSGRVRLHVGEMKRNAVSRNSWYYRQLPGVIERLQPDIVHLSYPVPLNRKGIRVPTVLTLHDMYPYDIPGNFGFPKVWFNQFILQQCLRNVDAIACVSETTLERMRLIVAEAVFNRAVRIFNSVESHSECGSHSPVPGWSGEPFLLTIAQHRKNKNIPLLLSVYRELLTSEGISRDTKLVVVGSPGPETISLRARMVALGLEANVVFLEGISEDELHWCYRNCELLVAPSSIEGFGLPVAEALMSGCRVVCSDISAFREIDTEHCTFFALDGPSLQNLREAILSALALPKPLPISLPRFSPELIGEEYVQLYRQLLTERGFSSTGTPVSGGTPMAWTDALRLQKRETVSVAREI